MSARSLFRRTVALSVGTVLAAAFLCSTSLADDDAAIAPAQKDDTRIQWGPLFVNTLTFLAVGHTFRWGKEYYTREATLHGPYFEGWASAVGSLHGWGDGDEFLCNYVGHPMEGAVSGYIFSHNDPKYRAAEFGMNRDYWRGKTRAFMFSTAYAIQFEIGPLSEASIGKIQKYWPQQGLVDWAVTPIIGLAWTLAEDSLDKYALKPIEGRVNNVVLRAALLGMLNPSRSFANLMAFQYPWHRDSRPGIRTYDRSMEHGFARPKEDSNPPLDESDPYGRKHASFAFDIVPQFTSYGRLGCAGGGATLQLPLGKSFDALIDLSGCKLIGLPQDFRGDSLTYMLGARWSPKTARRIAPNIRFFVGGQKIYEERLYPDLMASLLAQGVKGTYYHDVYLDYTQNWTKNGLTLSVGGGLDLGFNRALGLRLVSVDYLHSWLSDLNGAPFDNGIRISTGLTVNMGSW